MLWMLSFSFAILPLCLADILFGCAPPNGNFFLAWNTYSGYGDSYSFLVSFSEIHSSSSVMLAVQAVTSSVSLFVYTFDMHTVLSSSASAFCWAIHLSYSVCIVLPTFLLLEFVFGVESDVGYASTDTLIVLISISLVSPPCQY